MSAVIGGVLGLAADPGQRALRRTTRIAVIAPATLFTALHIPFLSGGTLLASFSCLSLTLFADFGGPLRRRFTSYLIATAAGVPLIVVGVWASSNLLASIITAFLIALIVGVAAVLRGPVAAAQSVLLLAVVLALTAVAPSTLLPSLAGWVYGGLVAATAAVLLWPAQSQRAFREGIAGVLEAIADACDARWVDNDQAALSAARDRSTEALTTLHARYDGDLLRPSGVTEAERALAELVDEVGRLRYLQRWRDVSPQRDPYLVDLMANECRRVTQVLRACANRLAHGDADWPTRSLTDLRARSLDDMSQWLADHRDTTDTTVLRQQIDDAFPLRITTLVASRIMDLTITVSPRPGDPTPGDTPEATSWSRIRAHLSWDSPWLRNGLRTAVALAISVAVAKSVSLEHPFWIVLGTLSALRFDALGTGRQAWQVLVGTTVGVAISAGVLTLVGDQPLVWWLLLPVVLFIAGYTPGTTSFAASQAAFTLTVIVLVSIIEPSGVALAEARWVDVVLGLAISLLASALIWPRGVVETLYKRMREAMTSACDFYVASADWLADGAIDDRLFRQFDVRSRQSLDRAREALDLSIAQRPPKTIALPWWTAMGNTIRHVDYSGRLAPLVRQIVVERGDNRPIPMPLVGPLIACSADVRARLLAATEVWADRNEPGDFSPEMPPDFTTADSVVLLRASIDAYLRMPSDWRGSGPDPRPTVVTWLTDWCALFDQSAHARSDR